MKEKKEKNSILKLIIQISPLVMIAVMAVVYLTCLRGVTVQQVLNYTPDNKILAGVVIILMFGLKSLSYFFPMFILYAVSGCIFSLMPALSVNLIGMVVMMTIPYLIGRYAERELVEKLISKSKNIDKINELRTEGQLFTSFFLRVISCLPFDIVSMTLGSMGIGYKKYLIGSILGTLPGMLAATVMGDAVNDPFSPQFIGAAAFDMFFAVLSVIVYRIYNSKKKTSDKKE